MSTFAKSNISICENPWSRFRTPLLPPLPHHAAAFQDALLDFKSLKFGRLGVLKEKEFLELDDSLLGDAWIKFKNIQQEAEQLSRGPHGKSEWASFFFENFFQGLVNESSCENGPAYR